MVYGRSEPAGRPVVSQAPHRRRLRCRQDHARRRDQRGPPAADRGGPERARRWRRRYPGRRSLKRTTTVAMDFGRITFPASACCTCSARLARSVSGSCGTSWPLGRSPRSCGRHAAASRLLLVDRLLRADGTRRSWWLPNAFRRFACVRPSRHSECPGRRQRRARTAVRRAQARVGQGGAGQPGQVRDERQQAAGTRSASAEGSRGVSLTANLADGTIGPNGYGRHAGYMLPGHAGR